LPKKCIVLIDSAGIGREQGPSSQAPEEVPPIPLDLLAELNLPLPPQLQASKSRGKAKGSMVTLSGLLNAIDGNASQEGRLLIMTSNNPDALDPALTRPGRIDKKVYFAAMSKAASKSIFLRLMGRFALAPDVAITTADIEQYADKFADHVPANVFTPAQLQNFLQDCRGDPLKALREIDGWVLENGNSSKTGGANGSSDSSACLA
jgi:chaperone BCS1